MMTRQIAAQPNIDLHRLDRQPSQPTAPGPAVRLHATDCWHPANSPGPANDPGTIDHSDAGNTHRPAVRPAGPAPPGPTAPVKFGLIPASGTGAANESDATDTISPADPGLANGSDAIDTLSPADPGSANGSDAIDTLSPADPGSANGSGTTDTL